MAKKRTIYRDKKTGRFTSKKTWKRGIARGSKRYKREKVQHRRLPGGGIVIPPSPPEAEVHEYIISFSYDKSGRSFDVIVTATSQKQAQQVAKGFLASDKKGRNISRAGFSGWSITAAQGDASDQDVGEAEYRSES